MTSQGANVASGSGVPELDRTVMSAGRHHAPVRREGEAADAVDKPAKCALLAAARRVPELDRPVTVDAVTAQ
jgi:hypothetical protein